MADLINGGGTSDEMLKQILEELKSLHVDVKDIDTKDPINTSQTSARLFRDRANGREEREDRQKQQRQKSKYSYRIDEQDRFETKRAYGNVLDEFERGMISGLKDSDFARNLSDVLNDFADEIGVNLRDIPGKFANELGNQIMEGLLHSAPGKTIQNVLNQGLSAYNKNILHTVKSPVNISNTGAASINTDFGGVGGEFTYNYATASDSMAEFTSKVTSGVDDLGAAVSSSAKELGELSKGAEVVYDSTEAVSSGMGALSSTMGILAIGMVALTDIVGGLDVLEENGSALSSVASTAVNVADKGIHLMTDWYARPITTISKLIAVGDKLFNVVYDTTGVVSGVKKVFGDVKDALGFIFNLRNRYYDTRDKELEYQKERIKADIETIVKYPFQILEDAAKKVEDAWDASLNVITSSQLYTKSDVQTLMSDYGKRLASEGLTSYVAGSDIVENLSRILQKGLSGNIAEEFAYQATKLNAIIPTQDFFDYASTYSSIIANAVKNGKDQDEAITEANRSLYDFADNLLYAGRVLAGGASTGLTNASSLYEQSVQIAQAAKSTNYGEISTVMTTVSSIVGAIAPDLANSITTAVYNAAVGGNSSSIVALRSLAGGNASNTEFLRNLVNNPREVFYNLFSTLDKMFTDSSDAYMEKAEGYADLFGLSAESFQRVDWKYLANSIKDSSRAYDASSGELSKNLALLKSGETTLTKEQLVNQKINDYMIEEGLSYVLDNEVARSIQEHMWEEQIARELQESTYGVEITGTALKLIEDIKQLFVRAIDFLNPFSSAKNTISELVFTSNEAYAQHADLGKILNLGKVGSGNIKELYGLTTTGQNLNLTKKYVELLGGTSSDWGLGGTAPKHGASQWLLGKLSGLVSESSIMNLIENGLGITDWIKQAQNEGIEDVEGVLNQYGQSIESVTEYYDSLKAQYDTQKQADRYVAEEEFWNSGKTFFGTSSFDTYTTNTEVLWNTMISEVDSIKDILQNYVDQFSSYFIQHEVYSNAYKAADVERIRSSEKDGTGDAIMALAEALTANSTDLSDPMVQTNTLLAKILLVATTIMQQGNTANGQQSLPDQLNALAFGITK